MRTLRSVPEGMVTVLGTRGGGAGVESTAREESGGGGIRQRGLRRAADLRRCGGGRLGR